MSLLLADPDDPACPLLRRLWGLSGHPSAFGRRQQQYGGRIEEECTRGGPPPIGQTAHNQVRLALALISRSPRARPSLLSMPCSPGPCIRSAERQYRRYVVESGR